MWRSRMVDCQRINNLQVHPNPAQDIIELSWKHTQNIDISIIDILGKKKLDTTGDNEFKSLNVSNLEKGIYFLILDKNTVQKLIIN